MPLPLFALFLGAFAVGTNELIIAGLLPSLAGDLGVSIPSAGLLISGYAIGVAIGGPVLAMFTGRVPRKPLLIGLMLIFVAGNVLCALAPSYGLLMAARLVISCSHGLFFGSAMVIASQLVTPDRRSSSVALVVAGFTVANVIGAPAGTAIGNAFGWRASFWSIAGLGLLVALSLVLLIPASPPGAKPGEGSLLAELRAVLRQPVLMSYAMIALMMTAALSVFSYIVPILTEVTGLSVASVPWILLASGLGGIIGNLVGGRLGDWKPMPAMIGIFAAEIVSYFVLLAGEHRPVFMTAAVFIWSAVGLAFPAPVQGRVLKWTSDAPNLASTLISTAFNIGIAAGAWLGGLAIDGGWGYADLPWIGVIFATAACLVAIGSFALESRSGPAPVAV